MNTTGVDSHTVISESLDGSICPEDRPPHLTPREKQIIQLMAQGFSTKELSQHLHISFHTVETHRKHLLVKVNAKNTVHLVAMALRHEWI